MIWLVADNLPKPVVAWLMLSLVALLLVVILVAWLLGRLFGRHIQWGKPLVDPKKQQKIASPPDAWAESARRMHVERDDDDEAS